MTEREAWLYLAKRWKKPSRREYTRPTVTIKLRYPNASPSSGLCLNIEQLRRCGLAHKHSVSMKSALRNHKGQTGWNPLSGDADVLSDYIWPTTMRGAKQRVKFCLKMANLLKPKETTNGKG